MRVVTREFETFDNGQDEEDSLEDCHRNPISPHVITRVVWDATRKSGWER